MIHILKKLFGFDSNEKLRQKIEEGAFLVDVRSPTEFDAGHIKGSINIPLDRVAISLDKFKNKTSIIVYCRSGNRSSQAKSILNQKGFNNVINGGTWQKINSIINNY